MNDRSKTRINGEGEESDVNVSSTLRLVFVASIAATMLGCVTPWAGHNAVELPTANALPTTQSPPGVAMPTDPNLDPVPAATTESATELEIEQEATDKVTVDVVRGQSPAPTSPSYDSPGSPAGSVFDANSPFAAEEPAARVAQQQPVGNVYGGNAYGDSGGYTGGGYGADAYSGGSYSGYEGGGGYGMEPTYQQSAPGVSGYGGQTAQGYGPAFSTYDGSAIAEPFGGGPPADGLLQPTAADYADLVVNLRETQTGRFMFGVGVNSDLGLTAQAIIDERNFDWRRWPRSLSDIKNGTAWRGGGQTLRIEAVPGTEVQRYLVNFTQPYLFDTLPISFNVSAFLFDRRYFDWDEQRLGGRVGLGYRITPDLSLSVALRGEQVDLHNVRVRGVPIVERALGESDLFSGRVSLIHDTRDIPFAPTEGHYLELGYEQVFGSFDYPRANLDYRRYFLLKQRVDRSGRHTLGFSFKGGITGSDTPVYENYFAGGYATMRGFRFRHASPKEADMIVGGQLSLLGSVEYIFPVTADDMLRGALFCDYGTIEETYDNIDAEDFRVAFGAGLRINVPAMGPAPIAVDFAVPIARESTDRIQNFSFFVGFGR